MDGQEIQKVSDLFVEEQEWVPGYSAPFFVWLGMTGAVGVIALGAVWIFMHNRDEV